LYFLTTDSRFPRYRGKEREGTLVRRSSQTFMRRDKEIRMTRKPLVIATLVAGLATATLSMNASAGDPLLGAIIGGGIGAAIGHNTGQHRGGEIGAVAGAVIGSTIAANSGPYYGDGYYAPPPVAYGPAPAPYYAPAPAYVEAAPVYYAPPVYYGPTVSIGFGGPVYYGHRHYYGHHWHR
jgi:hypothetical protein